MSKDFLWKPSFSIDLYFLENIWVRNKERYKGPHAFKAVRMKPRHERGPSNSSPPNGSLASRQPKEGVLNTKHCFMITRVSKHPSGSMKGSRWEAAAERTAGSPSSCWLGGWRLAKWILSKIHSMCEERLLGWFLFPLGKVTFYFIFWVFKIQKHLVYEAELFCI